MSFRERIRKLFGLTLSPRKNTAGTAVAADAKATHTITKAEPKMVNTITLSTDMKTLYLIDDGRAIAFDLTNPKGVFIGVLKNQLTVATGTRVPGPSEPHPVGDAIPLPAANTLMATEATSAASVASDTIKIPITPTSQWSVTFHEEEQVMAIIGITDIDSSLPSEPVERSCKNVVIRLKDKASVGLRRLDKDLVLTIL